MPDATPNYGWRIPKSDGTDFIIPDDVRIPVTSIDTALKTTDNAATALTPRVTAVENRATALETRATTLEKTKMIGGTSTTSGGGHITAAHGQASTPVDAVVQLWKPTGGPGIMCQITGIDATNITFQVWDSAGAAVVSTSLRYSIMLKLP